MRIEMDGNGRLVIDARRIAEELPADVARDVALSLVCRDEVFREVAEMLVEGYTTDGSSCTFVVRDEMRRRIAESADKVAADVARVLKYERDDARKDAEKARERSSLLESAFAAHGIPDERLRKMVRLREEARRLT